MKKQAVWVLLALMISSTSFAAIRGTAEYEKMKEFKKSQRAAKSSEAAPSPSGQASGFWAKEGERSGANQWGPGIGNFVRNLNPMPFLQGQDKKYKERKTAK